MSPAKIVVTGGAGYIGSVVTSHLLAAGKQVTVVDRLVYAGESLLGFLTHPCFRFVKGDVRKPESFAPALAGADAVVHLAAIVGEGACEMDQAAAWSTNFSGTEAMLAAAREGGVKRFVFISTCSNYGVSDPAELADEGVPLRPMSLYARSKVEAERHVLDRAGDLCAVILRLGTICGLSPRMRFDLLVSEMARSAGLGDSLQVFAPEAWRPFLHIRDAARAVAHCLESPETLIRGKVFNVVGENYQKKQLVELVLRHYPQTRVTITEKRTDLRDYRVSGERIRRELGFETHFTVEDAFLETATAVAAGIFGDPRWAGYSATPAHAGRGLGG